MYDIVGLGLASTTTLWNCSSFGDNETCTSSSIWFLSFNVSINWYAQEMWALSLLYGRFDMRVWIVIVILWKHIVKLWSFIFVMCYLIFTNDSLPIRRRWEMNFIGEPNVNEIRRQLRNNIFHIQLYMRSGIRPHHQSF